jgi:hypothetical protein
MNLLKYINVPVLLISIVLGFLAVYITAPEKRKIIVYPTHDNAKILQYRDKTNSCFSIVEKEVKCPANDKDIAKMPMQS